MNISSKSPTHLPLRGLLISRLKFLLYFALLIPLWFSSRAAGVNVQMIHSDCFVLGTIQTLIDNARNLGLAALRAKLEGMKDVSNSALKHLTKEPQFGELLRIVQGAETHPKLIKLEEILSEHFHRFSNAGNSTRAIVFSHYRDSVQVLLSS